MSKASKRGTGGIRCSLRIVSRIEETDGQIGPCWPRERARASHCGLLMGRKMTWSLLLFKRLLLLLCDKWIGEGQERSREALAAKEMGGGRWREAGGGDGRR